MNERKSKNVVIVALCLTLIFMGVGFAALSAQLNVTTTATVSGTWDVHFSSASPVAATGINEGSITDDTKNAFKAITEDDKTTSLTVGLKLVKPGDSATFTVKAKNFGTIKAALKKIQSIGVTPDGTSVNFNSSDIIQRTIVAQHSSEGSPEVKIPDFTLGNGSGEIVPSGITDLQQNDFTTFTITYTLNKEITEMPAFNTDTNNDGTNDAYVVTDTLNFTYEQA